MLNDFGASAQMEDAPFKDLLRAVFSFLAAPKYVRIFDASQIATEQSIG